MIVSDLPPTELRASLRGPGLALQTASFVTRIRSPIGLLADAVGLLYGDYPVAEDGEFADFQVRVAPPAGIRRWLRPQTLFYVDGLPPFKPLPFDQAFPILEWGLNWCISNHVHDHVVLHAAVVAKGDDAAILPAPPGSGKSTLCAALISRGWRLLSDELTLVRLADGTLAPLPRPVSLKNRSIDVIRSYAPGTVFSRVVHDTVKGSVAHMKPPTESVARALEPATPRWVVFPRYVADAAPRMEPLSKAAAFMRIAENAFNYAIQGAQGFATLCRLIDACDCYEFSYSRLDDAVAAFAAL